MKFKILCTTVFLVAAAAANSAEMLVGDWKTANGETAAISRCGTDYCITAKTGPFAGAKLGIFSDDAGNYQGRLTDPKTKAVYKGTLVVSGDSLKLRGCANGVLCKTQTWTRLN